MRFVESGSNLPTNSEFPKCLTLALSHPAFANRSVYARNDKEIVAVSLEKK